MSEGFDDLTPKEKNRSSKYDYTIDGTDLCIEMQQKDMTHSYTVPTLGL